MMEPEITDSNDVFHPVNKEDLLNSSTDNGHGNERMEPNIGIDGSDDGNETTIVASLSTGVSETSSKRDAKKLSFFGRGSYTRSSAGSSDRDDTVSESSRGSYKRYSVWTK